MALHLALGSFLILTTSTINANYIKSGVTNFAIDVYRVLSENSNKNILFSPISAEVALALLQSGTSGETADTIRKVSHLPGTDEAIQKDIGEVLLGLQGGTNVTLYSPNKLFVQQDFPIKTKYANVAQSVYKADVQNVNFNDNKKSVDIIRNWVATQTHNKINNFNLDSIDPLTKLVIVNVLYFKGSWLNAFPKKYTAKSVFYSPSKALQVDFMHIRGKKFTYFKNNERGIKYLEMPFVDNRMSMVIVLPTDSNGLPEIEKNVDDLFRPLKFGKIEAHVALPKFRIEDTIDLKTVLSKLGGEQLFGPKADYSGIAGDEGQLTLNDIIQKTFINIDETGGEAAAVTTIVHRTRSVYHPPRPITFIANHPFLFYIKTSDGLILFVGRVNTPLGDK